MEIDIADSNEEERIALLYDAAQKGHTSTLSTLLHENPLILHRLCSHRTPLETPLHISALLDHLEFTKILLSNCPKLALELDSSLSTPLHLASAQGHVAIVKELLKACGDQACFVRDQEHRIPLHYAVIGGRREVASELIRAKPESLTFRDDKGKNILHLCVMHNQLEILKDLVALDTHFTNNMLNEGDLDGNNTILHMAIMLKQVETVGYLVTIPKIRSKASNLKNNMGYNAADIVEQIPKDSMSLVIQMTLMEFGIKHGKKERNDFGNKDKNGQTKWSCRNVLKSIDKRLEYKGNWVAETRGNLSLVATVLATISFQATTNPPGSVIQQGIRPSDPNFNLISSNATSLSQGPLGCLNYKGEIGHIGSSLGSCPGKAMLAYREPHKFGRFITYNTISFVASMILVLLLVSGVPLTNKAMVRVLSIAMIVAVTCFLNAYFSGLALIAPHTRLISDVVTIACWTFNSLNVLVGLYVAAQSILSLKDYFAKHSNSSDRGRTT